MESEDCRPIMAKEFTFLDCVPAHTDKPSDGDPTIMLTLSHLDEVESPMIVTLNDAKRLVLGLLRSLAYFDDTRADLILDQHFGERLGTDRNDWIAETPAAPTIASSNPTPPPSPTDGRFKITLKRRKGSAQRVMTVTAGFRCGRDHMIVGIVPAARRPQMTLMLNLPKRQLKAARRDEQLRTPNWEIACLLPPGKEAKIGKRTWERIALPELQQLLGDHTYWLVK